MTALQDTFAGRHLVLTGVTGFVGKVFLVLLLDRFPEIGRVTVLVRGGREGAEARFTRIADTSPCFRPLKARWGRGYGEFLGERVRVLESDLLRPDCGLGREALSELADADLILHCAGMTDFDPDPKRALATNTDGALRVAELAERLGARLVHVSTAYVAGVADGTVEEAVTPGRAPNGVAFDPSAELEAARQAIHRPRLQDRVDAGRARAAALGWPNIYTWTKGLAEHLLASRPGLKLTIARPSIVECALSFPFPGWNEGVNTAGPLAWLISTAFRRLPAAPDHRFDIVPVDLVAKGLLLACAASLRDEAPAVVHLATGDDNPLTFRRTIELTGLALRRFTRKGGGTELERAWFRHLDPVPGDGGWFVPADTNAWLPTLSDGLDRLGDVELPERVRGWRDDLRKRLDRARTDVERVEDMLAMYRPFIREHDWRFRTEAARSLNRLTLSDVSADRELAFDVRPICWRSYWIDVEYPGLMRWSIPILRNQPVPVDQPSDPALSLARSERVASK